MRGHHDGEAPGAVTAPPGATPPTRWPSCRLLVVLCLSACSSSQPGFTADASAQPDAPVDSATTVVDSTTTADAPPGRDVPGGDAVTIDVRDAGVASDVVVTEGGAGPSVRFVGQEDDVTEFRTTGVTRRFDLDGDGVYGTAGYVFYAMRTGAPGGDGVFIDGDPLTFASGAFQTVSSMPRYLQLASNGMDTSSGGYTYPPIDDPRRGPAASVENIESGLGLHNIVTIGTEGSLLDLTVRAGAPATFRVGVMAIGRGEDAMLRVRLAGASGGAEGTRAGTPTTFVHFFDIVGAREGDRFTLSMTKDSMGTNPNVAHLGIVIDG